MYAPVIHYLRQTNIRHSRLLTVPGRVMVSPGQKVASTDVIAEAPNPTVISLSMCVKAAKSTPSKLMN